MIDSMRTDIFINGLHPMDSPILTVPFEPSHISKGSIRAVNGPPQLSPCTHMSSGDVMFPIWSASISKPTA